MFKLKIIDKPEMFKMKCNFEFPKIPIENLQEKEIDPTTKKQEVVPDKEYSALSKVTVNAVTSDIDKNILSKNIRSGVEILGVAGWLVPLNGEERIVTPTKSTQVIEPSEGKNAITKVTVKPYTPIVDKKTITSNGTYKASDDNLDGYNEVVVATTGVDINDYFDLTKKSSGNAITYIKKFPLIDTSSYTIVDKMFYDFSKLLEIPLLDFSNVTSMIRTFSGCSSITVFPNFNTSKCTNMEGLFSGCTSLITAPMLDTSKIYRPSNTSYGGSDNMFNTCTLLETVPEYDFETNNHVYSMFENCKNLKNLSGFLNYGKALSTTGANNSYAGFDFRRNNNLTHDSLMNVINKLYDIAGAGYNVQKLTLGSTNLAKLTAEELAIATHKGWNVS